MSDESESTERLMNPTPVPHDDTRATVREGRSLRVLIVDGNADAAALLASFVRRRGHDVCWTCDGATALEVAQTQEPQVVLLAIDMEEMDGFQLAQRLRCDSRLKTCYLIAMRDKADARRHQQCAAADIDLFLAKPVDRRLLDSLLSWEGERLDDFDKLRGLILPRRT